MKKGGNAGPLEAIAEEGQENVGPAEAAKTRMRVRICIIYAMSRQQRGAFLIKIILTCYSGKYVSRFESTT